MPLARTLFLDHVISLVFCGSDRALRAMEALNLECPWHHLKYFISFCKGNKKVLPHYWKEEGI